MKHISKKIAAIDEPLEISHYIHEDMAESLCTSSNESSPWKYARAEFLEGIWEKVSYEKK